MNTDFVVIVMHFELWFVVAMQEDPEIPFTEEDYRRRKPHPNFKDHISAEKMIIKYGKTVSSCTFVLVAVTKLFLFIIWANSVTAQSRYADLFLSGDPVIIQLFCVVH